MNVTSTLIEAHIFRIINSKLEFLLLQRSADEIYPNIWQMVTGTIEASENAAYAALREIKEETGLDPIKFWIVPNVNSFYSFDRNEICMVPVFACMVDTEANVIISVEHSQYRWVDSDEARSLLAWPGQRESVKILSDYFSNQQSFFKLVELDINSLNKL